MNSISLQLVLVLTSLATATAIPAVDNGIGTQVLLPEEKITDFAVLTGNNLGNLPPEITFCSSIATGTFISSLSPFQLLYQNGKPWITIYFYPAQEDSRHHRMIFFVSFGQNLK